LELGGDLLQNFGGGRVPGPMLKEKYTAEEANDRQIELSSKPISSQPNVKVAGVDRNRSSYRDREEKKRKKKKKEKKK